MSEFKFVCPACGQHIKCESWRRNSMMECPMCFQRVIVPQAPAGDDVELIIKGSKATKRLVTKPAPNLGMPPAPRPPAKDSPVAGIAFVILLCAVIAAAFVFGGKIFKSTGGPISQTPSAPVGPKSPQLAICIRAGSFAPFTDSEGNVWLPDQGFADGNMADHSPENLQISNTKDPALYCSERYSMTSFSYPVPNGKYTVKLHFAENYKGITGPGQRVFSFNVEGHEFEDFDIWVKAGGPNRAYIETVSVEVTDGELDISFTSNVQNPEINGIEIIPETAGLSVVTPPANDTNWTLNLDAAAIPDSASAGYVHGKVFIPEQAVLDAGTLTLRTANGGPPDEGVSIHLHAIRSEDFAGRAVNVKTNSINVPWIDLRWNDGRGQPMKQTVKGGYALRIEFGRLAGNQLPGKIYLCTPDEMKSYVLGTFNAEIRKPKPSR
jgi:DNA-directed RNA polymerase subunit RPC12/RpoP